MSALAAGVHSGGEADDLTQSDCREVFPSRHSPADVGEQLEVALLAGSHGISVEVRDDSFDDQREVSHLPLERLVAAVGSNSSAAEVSLHFQQHLRSVAVLTHRETWSCLPASPKFRAWREGDREASLPVDVARHVRREMGLTSILRARVLHRTWICHTRTVWCGWDRADASPRRDQSLRGHTHLARAEDFPRHCPPAPAPSLIGAAGEGFAVMSGLLYGITPVPGN
jgi:hypothetical protein